MPFSLSLPRSGSRESLIPNCDYHAPACACAEEKTREGQRWQLKFRSFWHALLNINRRHLCLSCSNLQPPSEVIPLARADRLPSRPTLLTLWAQTDDRILSLLARGVKTSIDLRSAIMAIQRLWRNEGALSYPSWSRYWHYTRHLLSVLWRLSGIRSPSG